MKTPSAAALAAFCLVGCALSAVDPAPPGTEKEIASFFFSSPPATGVVDQGAMTITVVVPAHTAVSSLTASFTTTGAHVTVGGIEQISGQTENDFTAPLVYVVTAGDRSEARYAVTVTPSPDTEKALIAFSILTPPADGIIDPAARIVRVRLPEGTDLSGLVAMFATTGKEVTVDGMVQESGVTVNDFSAAVSYVVTAEDGSEADWSVRVVGTIGLLINELDVDQVGADTAEYIELYASADVDPAGVVIILLNGGVIPGLEYARIDLSPVGPIDRGSYCVVAGPGVAVPLQSRKHTPPGWELSNRIQNGPADAVMLFDTLGKRVIDTVSYNGVLHRAVIAGEEEEVDATEGAAGAPADSNAVTGSIGRIPDGVDSNQNGADFKMHPTLTPGAPNL